MPKPSPKPLEYSALPAARYPLKKKPLLLKLGWILLSVPMLCVLGLGLILTLSNLIAPERSWQMGEASITPVSDGTSLELLKVVIILGLMLLWVSILWFGLRKSKSAERD